MTDLACAPIGNGTIAALVDRGGRHVWCCFPRLDGDPMFSALVDGGEPRAGFMDVILANGGTKRQAYRRNTAILETEIADPAGNAIRIVDLVPRFKRFGRLFHPPMLIRRIEPLSGRARIVVRIRPRFGYGASDARKRVGSNHVRFVADDAAVRVTTDVPVSSIAEEVPFLLDRPATLILAPDETLPDAPDRIAREFVDETEAYWQDWTRFLSIPFEWQEAVIRAAITLKLSCFEETGGIVAALTTSIPEAPGTARNWDYRFCWLRDAFFTVHALNRLGATRTMENYVRYLMNAVLLEEGSAIVPVYPIVPGTPMAEWIAEALAGYRGMGPVRVGNAAALQVQNDSYGSVILAATQMFFDARLPRPGDIDLYHRLARLGEEAARRAFEPDSGLWEHRGVRRVHTFSAAMCWAALARLGAVAERLALAADARAWREQAARLREEIISRAVDPRRHAFSGAIDDWLVDASVLLLPEIGLVTPNDPRFLATLEIVERELKRGPFILRYAGDEFGPTESAFVVCTFWYVDALAACGRREEARAVFEAVLARRNHVGLLSEDVDPTTGELWGNFPQTYSQVGLIVSAMRLSRSWEEGVWRVS